MVRFSMLTVHCLQLRRALAIAGFALTASVHIDAILAASIPTKITVGYPSPSPRVAPLWIAQDLDFFGKYGLSAQVVLVRNNQMLSAGIAAGDIDIGYTGGADVVLLGATIDLLPFEIWSAPAIKNPAQLKGTKMGVTRIGSTTHFFARYVLKQWGIKQEDDAVFFQTGGQPELFAALKSGAIQPAVLNAGPFTVRAQKEGFVRLADIAAMGRPYVYGTVVARESFIQSRPDPIRRFAEAFVEGFTLRRF